MKVDKLMNANKASWDKIYSDLWNRQTHTHTYLVLNKNDLKIFNKLTSNSNISGKLLIINKSETNSNKSICENIIAFPFFAFKSFPF